MAESSGFNFHFFEDWQSCKRNFYFRRIARLEGERRKGISIGQALHESVAAFRRKEDWRVVLWEQFETASFFDEQDRRTNYMKALGWMSSWTQRFGFTETGVVESEKVLEYGGFTGELDALIHYDPRYLIDDLKTSSYKADIDITQSELLSDQYTLYSWLVRKIYKVNPSCRITLAYIKPSIPVAAQSEEFYITPEAQDDYIEGLFRHIEDIRETLDAFADGISIARCFPRNSKYCSMFGCEFSTICRNYPDIRKGNPLLPAPAGFGIRPEDPRIIKLNSSLGGKIWNEERE